MWVDNSHKTDHGTEDKGTVNLYDICGMELQFPVLLTSALDQGKWSVSCPDCLPMRERAHGIHETDKNI